MADEEPMDWVFDSLVGFLKGPIWTTPVLTFIENKSVIFEPGEENEEEYKKTFDEYKNLVDFMLGSHMEDLGITPEEFEKACEKSPKHICSEFQHSLFEQIWAANDFETFRRMMTKKNIDLQLQALELMARQHGMVPKSMIALDSTESEGDAILELVLKRSLEEHQNLQNEEAARESLGTLESEVPRLEAERRKEESLLEQALKQKLQSEQLLEDSAAPAVSEQTVPKRVEDGPRVTTKTSPKGDILGSSNQFYKIGSKAQVDPEEAARRQEYLRQQRDKLLALKKEEREKQFKTLEEEESPVIRERPRSARAAKAVVSSSSPAGDLVEPKSLAFRKSLAAKLKAEVVEESKKEE